YPLLDTVSLKESPYKPRAPEPGEVTPGELLIDFLYFLIACPSFLRYISFSLVQCLLYSS
ncbi:MAG TPA: hypothetical protein VNN20_16780, partial [Thermodesulfobacteriota bacterium]|nr:hypothetical protein [Thermodesulfobacteriota bacterium]